MPKSDTTIPVTEISDEAGELAKNIRDNIEGKFCGFDPLSTRAMAILAHDIQHMINNLPQRKQ